MDEAAGLNPVTSLSLSPASGLNSPTSKMVSSSQQNLTVTPLLTTVAQQQSEHQQQQQQGQLQQQQQQQQQGQEQDGQDDGTGPGGVPNGADATALLNQMNQLGPSDRCTPTQAQAMGQQLLSIIAYHERNKITLPGACEREIERERESGTNVYEIICCWNSQENQFHCSCCL